VLLDNVLEHTAEPAPLLAEVRRILPSGGRLLIGVPGVRGRQADPDHKVVHDRTTMVNRLGSAGFSPIRVFHTPQMRSDSMSRRLRQYCIYCAFNRA
jgi:SAM-dependent methyltransferase